MIQNIGRCNVGNIRKGGNIAKLRLNVHANKPDIVILTEISESDNLLNSKKIFRNYICTQHDFTGLRTGAVAVFARKNINVVDGTVNNSGLGHYTCATYNISGTRVVIAGVYGPACSSDNKANIVYKQLIEVIKAQTEHAGTQYLFIGGDFNLKLDCSNVKPKAVKTVLDFMQEHGLADAGENYGKLPTWRRPGKTRKKSRLDYVLYSEAIGNTKFELRWGKSDHANICCNLQWQVNKKKSVILKDWVFSDETFIKNSSDYVLSAMLDHDKIYRTKTQPEREEFLMGRKIKEIEEQLDFIEGGEGIFASQVFQTILRNFTQLHLRTQKDKISKAKKEIDNTFCKIKELQGEYDDLRPDDPHQDEIFADIESYKQKLADYAENKERAMRQRVVNFGESNDGNNVASSYRVTKESKSNKNIQFLTLDTGEDVTEVDKIADALTEAYRSSVGEKFQSEGKLQDFLEKYNVIMPKLNSQEYGFMDDEVTVDEVRDALASAKVASSPGPSGQSIATFKFLFGLIPGTMTRAINEMIFVPGFMLSENFEWVTRRRIVYIPKPNKPAHKVEGLRPLSMLETYYKLMTRILTKRINNTLNDVLYFDQHGFRSGHSIQTAVLPVLEAIRDAGRSGQPLQLLSIDIKAAFDTVSPECIKNVMAEMNFPSIFNDALDRITTTGSAYVSLNGCEGPCFGINRGAGQGDPASAPRFIIGSDPLPRALNRNTEAIKYSFSNSNIKMSALSYADDNLNALSLQNSQQLQDVLQIYKDFAKISGLEVSIGKTTIMCINTSDELVESIRRDTGIKVVTGFRYLGTEIRNTYDLSEKASYETIGERMQTKSNKINASFLSLFHRKQLISRVIMPSFNHIVMVFGFSDQIGKKLDDLLVKLLWTQKISGDIKQKRRLVARKRISASYNLGGLKIDWAETTAQGLMLNSLQRFRGLLVQQNDSNMTCCRVLAHKLIEVHAPSLNDLFGVGGSLTWEKWAGKLQQTSKILSQMFWAYSKMLKLNEKSKQGWPSAPIVGHTDSYPVFEITLAEGITLKQQNLTCVAQLFYPCYFSGALQLQLDAEIYDEFAPEDLPLANKCKSLRCNLAKKQQAISMRVAINFSQAIGSLKWSGLHRKLKRQYDDSFFPGPPAYFTRQRDGIPVPSLARFMAGYDNIFKMDISNKTREVAYHVMNRQIWTNKKFFLSGSGEINETEADCGLCGDRVVEDTMHLIFTCPMLSEMVWLKLSDSVTEIFANSDPPGKRIQLHAFNVLYNQDVTVLPTSAREQLHILIQEVKRALIYKRYVRSSTGRAIRYNDTRIQGFILNMAKKVISSRQYQGKKHDFLMLLQQHTANQI